MKKIIYIADSLTPIWGAYKAMASLLENLATKDIIPLIVVARDEPCLETYRSAGIQVEVLNYFSSVYPKITSIKDLLLFIPRLVRKLVFNSIATIRLINIAKIFEPDLIHSNVSLTAIGYYTARLLKIPHIWHIREYGDKDFSYHYYPCRNVQINRYKKNKSYTLCITKDIQCYNVLTGWKNTLVVYDGVLSQNLVEFSSNKKEYFLFAGRLEHAKGILPLIDAYAQYCQQHPVPLPLHVAGNGTNEYVQLVKNKIQEYGIDDKVILLGVRKDILELYKNARAFIVPSLAEGFGFITAEAMFCGCLVIGNNTAGTKEQFDNGLEMTGEEIALRYTKQEELVQHLIDVTNNPTRHYEPMILRAQQVVAQLYSTEKHAERVYEFYNYILNQNT